MRKIKFVCVGDIHILRIHRVIRKLHRLACCMDSKTYTKTYTSLSIAGLSKTYTKTYTSLSIAGLS